MPKGQSVLFSEDLSNTRKAEHWGEGHPELSRLGDLSFARQMICGYRPSSRSQANERERILEFIDQHPNALNRSCSKGHLTASALVLDAKKEKVLLTHHRKLQRWLQLGGHCDGDGNLAAAAWREATEESGISGLEIDPHPIDLDIHTIPARGSDPEHWHLDVRFLVFAPVDAIVVVSEESIALRWFEFDRLPFLESDESVQRLVQIASRLYRIA